MSSNYESSQSDQSSKQSDEDSDDSEDEPLPSRRNKKQAKPMPKKNKKAIAKKEKPDWKEFDFTYIRAFNRKLMDFFAKGIKAEMTPEQLKSANLPLKVVEKFAKKLNLRTKLTPRFLDIFKQFCLSLQFPTLKRFSGFIKPLDDKVISNIRVGYSNKAMKTFFAVPELNEVYYWFVNNK